jgi:Clr5 domain
LLLLHFELLTAQSLICCLLWQAHVQLLVMVLSINEELLRARHSDISDNGSYAPWQDDAQQALYLQDWHGDLDKFDNSQQEQVHQAHDLNSNAHDFGDKQRIPEQAPLGACGLENYPTKEEWQEIKPIFTKLFINEDKPLNEVKAILERDRDFVAT